jgi:hypothetical protein
MPLGPVNTVVEGSSAGANYVQPLPDGDVLMVGATAYRLRPDSSGSYGNPTLIRVADPPFTAVYGAVTVANDGSVIQHLGEFGTSIVGTTGRTCVFNTNTDTWVAYETANAFANLESIASHNPVVVTDDGRHIGYTRSLAADTTVVNSSTVSATSWSDGMPSIEIEEGLVHLPNGSFLKFVSLSNPHGEPPYGVRRFFPGGYSSELIAAGSSNVAAGNELTSFVSALPVASVGAPGEWRGVRFTSPGPSVNYEVGPSFWMPKINKAVLLGGSGHVFTLNADGTGLAVVAFMGMSQMGTLWKSPHRLGLIRSTNNGQTTAAAIAGGSLTIDATTSVFGPATTASTLAAAIAVDTTQNTNFTRRAFHIRLAGNTRWSRVTFTGVSASGNEITFTGCSTLSNASLRGDTGTALATGDEVCWGRPSYQCMDSPGAFLPNGDYLFIAGITWEDRNGNFDQLSELLKFDGTTVTRISTDDVSFWGASSFSFTMTPLPTGEVLIARAGVFRIYTPTTEEAVPLASARPVVTSVPSVVSVGSVATVSGTTLNGVTEGAAFGDDKSPRSNFPVFRFVNNATGAARYVGSRNWSYRGIQPGRSSTCLVPIPSDLTPGQYTVTAIASGVASATSQQMTVVGAAGDPTFIPKM